MVKDDNDLDGWSDQEVIEKYSRQVDSMAESDAEFLYSDFSDTWAALIHLVGDFRDDDQLIRKVQKLSDWLDEVEETIKEELPGLVKDEIRELFE